MPITVKHLPSFQSVGDASRTAGQGKSNRQERLIAEQRGFQVANREDTQAFSAGENDKTREFSREQTEDRYEQEERMAQVRAGFNEVAKQSDALRRKEELEYIQDEAREQEKYTYSTQQKRTIAEAEQNRANIEAARGNTLNDAEADFALKEIDQVLAGVSPTKTPQQYKDTEQIGMIFKVGENSWGTRNADGNVKILGDVDPGKVTDKVWMEQYAKNREATKIPNPKWRDSPLTEAPFLYRPDKEIVNTMISSINALENYKAGLKQKEAMEEAAQAEGVGVTPGEGEQFADPGQAPPPKIKEQIQTPSAEAQEGAINSFLQLVPMMLSDSRVSEEDKQSIMAIENNPNDPGARQTILILSMKYGL
jgi:hypothetical protein